MLQFFSYFSLLLYYSLIIDILPPYLFTTELFLSSKSRESTNRSLNQSRYLQKYSNRCFPKGFQIINICNYHKEQQLYLPGAKFQFGNNIFYVTIDIDHDRNQSLCCAIHSSFANALTSLTDLKADLSVGRCSTWVVGEKDL